MRIQSTCQECGKPFQQNGACQKKTLCRQCADKYRQRKVYKSNLIEGTEKKLQLIKSIAPLVAPGFRVSKIDSK